MEQFTFKKGDVVKVCHCHEGVRETLLAEGWVEQKPKPAAKPKKKEE